MGVEHWTWPGEWGWGKEPNFQWTNTHVKQQRLRVRLRWQANLPVEQLALSRDRERHKGLERERGNKPTSQRSRQHSAEIRKSTKAESRGGATGQPPKARQVVDPRDDLWDRGQHSKVNSPALLGEELTTQSFSWRATQLPLGENNSSDHPAQAGSLSSPHNSN
jgi:hypothetical protein